MEISDRYWKEIKKCAERRNIDFNLRREDAFDVFLQQERRCKFTNLPIDFTSMGHRGTASLDRLDNDKPYSKNNVQWVHSHINVMRGSHNIEYFLKMCTLVASRQSSLYQSLLSEIA